MPLYIVYSLRYPIAIRASLDEEGIIELNQIQGHFEAYGLIGRSQEQQGPCWGYLWALSGIIYVGIS